MGTGKFYAENIDQPPTFPTAHTNGCQSAFFGNLKNGSLNIRLLDSDLDMPDGQNLLQGNNVFTSRLFSV